MTRQAMIDCITASESSRRVTHKDMSLRFITNIVRATINENHRLAFTRCRVSGHSLVCETGSWKRLGRGRLPLQQRLGIMWSCTDRDACYTMLCNQATFETII